MFFGFLSSEKFVSAFAPLAISAALHVGIVTAVAGFWNWDGGDEAPRPQVVVIELVEARGTALSSGARTITDKKGAISQKAQKEKRRKQKELAVLSTPSKSSDIVNQTRIPNKIKTKDLKTQQQKKRSLSAPGSHQQMKGAAKTSVSHGPKYSGKGLSNPRPRYPQAARLKGQQGRVVLKVRVSSKGRAVNVRVSRSSGVKALDHSAMRAVKKWRFHPARKNGQPVVGVVYTPINFRLVN